MDEASVALLRSLQSELRLEMKDASNQGDRIGAKSVERVVNAIERTIARAATAADRE